MGFFTQIHNAIKNAAKTVASKAVTTPAKKTTTAASIGTAIAAGAAALAATTKKTNPQQPQPANPAPLAYQPPDTDIVTWSGNGGISFFVKPTKVQGVSEISVEASANTEDKEEDGEKLAKRKTNGTIQITMKAVLNAFLGADVQGIANKAIEAARKGDSGYLYSYGKKLYTCQFIMADAKATNILMSGTGTWISCELNLTLKQTSKTGGATQATGGTPSGGGGGSKKTYSATVYYSASSGAVQSVTRTSTVSQADAEKKAWAAVPGNAQWASLNPKQATNQTQAKDTIKTTNDAKKQSQKVLQDSKRTTSTNVGMNLSGANKILKINVLQKS